MYQSVLRDRCRLDVILNTRPNQPEWEILAKRLGECYTGTVYDVMRELGLTNCVLPPEIRALNPKTRVSGRVFTMQGRPDPTIDAHESLIRWTEFLAAALGVTRSFANGVSPADAYRAYGKF